MVIIMGIMQGSLWVVSNVARTEAFLQRRCAAAKGDGSKGGAGSPLLLDVAAKNCTLETPKMMTSGILRFEMLRQPQIHVFD